MSRVQKGSAIFKPITKARPRPAPGAASRQASIVVDAPTEPAGTSAPTILSAHQSIPSPLKDPATIGSSGVRQQSQGTSANTEPEPAPGPSTPPISQKHPKPPSLAPSTTKKSEHVKGNAISVPSRSASTQVATGSLRPPTQAPAPVSSSAMTPAPPTLQSGDSIPPATSGPIASSSTAKTVVPIEPSAEQTQTESHSAGKGARKRKRSTTAPDDDDASSTSSKTKNGRGRRSRAPSLPPYDPNADPGEDLDPTVVTMASLCDDTGQGRVSSKAVEVQTNHAIWKKQNREKRARMRAIMEARKYGRTEQEAELMEDNGSIPTPSSITPSTSQASAAPAADDTNPEFDYTQDLATSRYNVQVRIGPNGETIIDEESLVVNREEPDDTTTYTHVTESDTSKFVNSGTYSKRFRGSRWSAEETELFYDALMQHGENYELIAYMLPGRDRKSCKNKFKVEDKRNPARINYCLNNGTAPDIAYLSLMTGKDFSGPVPEIRGPSTPVIPPPPVDEPMVPDAAPEHTPSSSRKRRTKTPSADDDLMIVGDANTIVPNFDS